MPSRTLRVRPALLRAVLAAVLAAVSLAGIVLDAAPSAAAVRTRTAIRANSAGTRTRTTASSRTKRPRVEPTPTAKKPTPGSPVASPRLKNAPIRSVSTSRKVIALTFDDGPSSASPEVCATLRRYGVEATFFNVGSRVLYYPEETKEEAEVGEVQNHSYDHGVMTDFSLRRQIDQVVFTDTRIEITTGVRPRWFRPRGGLFDNWTQLAVARAGTRMLLWNVEAVDTSHPTHTAATITANVLNGAKPGAIVLMHETNEETRKALPGIIAGLKAKGYKMTTVSKLVDGTY